MSKIIYGVLVFYFSFVNVYSQDVIDNEEKYKLLALHTLFSEGLNTDKTIINEENLVKFFTKTNLIIKEIDQENFSGIKFFHVKKEERKDNEIVDLSLPVIWDTSSCDGYIIAISEGSNYVFKLRGFKINEFYSFLKYVRSKYNPIKEKKKKFIKKYKVKGLDFECLFKSIQNLNKEEVNERLPCISDMCDKVLRTHDF